MIDADDRSPRQASLLVPPASPPGNALQKARRLCFNLQIRRHWRIFIGKAVSGTAAAAADQANAVRSKLLEEEADTR